MAVTIVATPGSATANSYLTLAEANTYFESRAPLPVAWRDLDGREALLVMATRVMDAALRGQRVLVQAQGSQAAYYAVRRTWTGLPATTTQRLAWPRTGMLDQNGNAIGEAIVPQDLKDAVAELAGQLGQGDRTLDSDAAIQGITSVRAGSVSVSFRDGYIDLKVLPSAVVDLLVPSWYTEEQIDAVSSLDFEVITPTNGCDSRRWSW